ncbi:MAG: DUF362 domain-containing protein [Myxococcales bacterium]|nr:MAG: DUF362 domain-containing protein [Myxococcales bacterium]
MAKAKVAVLRTTPATVVEDYRRLVEMAGAEKALDKNATTILKDNITWHFAYPGVNTTPWQLEGTILGLKDLGFTDLVDVHNHTVVTDPFKGEVNLHFKSVYEKYKIPRKFNFREEDMKWEIYKPKATMHALHKVFPDGIRIPDYFQGKNIVQLPTMKTHTYTTYTGAMKNAFGGLLSFRRHYTHTWIHETLVDLLAISKEIHSGIFATMDGATAADGPGPRTVRPHDKNVILASPDWTAIDAVAAKTMGFDPMQIPCIRIAHDDGLGVGDPREIEIVGDASILNENWHFEVGANFATGVGTALWHSPLKVFQKLLFHTPIVHIFVMASAVYHDQVHYPTWGRPIFDKWLAESPWGELFKQYASADQIPDRPSKAR